VTVGLLPSSQRDQIKIAVGLVGVALAGAYYTYPYTARSRDVEAMRVHVETLDGQNAKARAQASRNDVTKLRAEAARTGASLDMMRRLVPTEHEVPALLEEISTAARRAGLEIGGVAPDPVLRGDEFDTFRYRVTVVGGYHALSTFLANVGSLPRIVAPVAFTLTPGPDVPSPNPRAASRGPSLTASVTLQTYVAHGVAPTPGAPNGSDAGATRPVSSTGETQP
jgi:type IV pilus assembly protein PilO